MVESRVPDTQGGPLGLEQSLRPTILVVDDDSMIRTLVRECLALVPDHSGCTAARDRN